MREYFGIKGLFWPLPKPFPYDHHEREQFRNLDPFQVFSCWNGAALIDPRAFFVSSLDSKNSITRRLPGEDGTDSSEEEVVAGSLAGQRKRVVLRSDSNSSFAIRFRTARNDDSPITEKASECFLICVDLWRRGMGKILMVPKAR